MTNFIIGTCGHIDHGKTSLIHALNGFEGDSTNEEKQRRITIDLSLILMEEFVLIMLSSLEYLVLS